MFFPMLLLFTACTGSDVEPPASPPVPADPPSQEPAEPPPEPEPAPAGPLPPGADYTGEPVALLGHGIRMSLNPPFQAAWMGSLEGEGAMVVAWWDVDAERAGHSGAAGLYNVSIQSAPVPDGEPTIRTTTVEHRGRTVHALQLGETGTLLQLPEGHNALGGMGSVAPGPAHAEWKVQVGDDEPMSWPEYMMLHSWDPADGGPAKFIKQPTKPWGPWRAGSESLDGDGGEGG